MSAAEPVASSIAATNAGAVTGPTLGTVRNRRTRGSIQVTASIRSSEYASCWFAWRMTAKSGAISESRRPGNGSSRTRWLRAFGGAGAATPAVLAEQRAGHRDVARPGPHEGIAHG